jgi:hypothetical protein
MGKSLARFIGVALIAMGFIIICWALGGQF